ncbi:hypothetical protein GCM10010272_64970 [Streptomyces lateritius]|nr:hypothetical protein GCM10010272_64970 [Streptomyces lateritius]
MYACFDGEGNYGEAAVGGRGLSGQETVHGLANAGALVLVLVVHVRASANCRLVAKPSGTRCGRTPGTSSLRGTRNTSRRRRFFLGRGITGSRRRAAGRDAAGNGGRGAADGAGRCGGAGGG